MDRPTASVLLITTILEMRFSMERWWLYHYLCICRASLLAVHNGTLYHQHFCKEYTMQQFYKQYRWYVIPAILLQTVNMVCHTSNTSTNSTHGMSYQQYFYKQYTWYVTPATLLQTEHNGTSYQQHFNSQYAVAGHTSTFCTDSTVLVP